VANVGNGDFTLRIEEFVVFEIGRNEEIGPCLNGLA
jgi:hypothetical protein